MNVEQEMVRYDRIRHINAYISEILYKSEHMHGAFELSYVLDGKAQYVQGTQKRTVTPGALILVNPYEQHSYTALDDKPVTLLTVQIHKLFLRRYVERIPYITFKTEQMPNLGKAQRDAITELMAKVCCAYLSNKKDSQFAAVGYATLLLGKLISTVQWKLESSSNNSGKELRTSRSQRLVSYIDENYRQKITLSMLAEMEGISTTYLSHFFRKAFGVSFQQYLKAQRLEKALVLLRDPNISMVDICMNCGFSDARYLEAACMETFGCSIAEYRQRAAEHGEYHVKGEGDALYRRCGQRETLERLKQYFSEEVFGELL